MKTLYLLRHAKAEPGDKATDDRDRVLSARGHEASALMGAYMKTKHYTPVLTLASPSTRTKETLAGVEKAMDIELKHRFDKVLYLATAEEIIRAVQEAEDDAASMMVVGHNPGMHHVALLLAAPKRTELRRALELKYPTCALAVLQFGARYWKDIAAGAGTLTDFVTPGEL